MFNLNQQYNQPPSPSSLEQFLPQEASAQNCAMIDLNALAQNYSYLNHITGDAVKCSAVVKGNAYGLGALDISKRLFQEGCQIFFVAYLDEGIALRQSLGPQPTIYVLIGYFNGTEDDLLAHDLIPVLSTLDQVESWQRYARIRGQELPAVIHVDTGMHRNGLTENDVATLSQDPNRLLGLSVKMIMSHLASSGDAEDPFNGEQRERFLALRRQLPLAPASFANSGGIFLGQDYHFNCVRPGTALYGLNPLSRRDNPMRPIIHIWTRIVQIQDLLPGETVGYFQNYVAKRQRRIATLAMGYTDGIPFLLANRGYVNLHGYQAPILGRVSMDLISVDVSDVPEHLIHSGQWIELLGNDITLDDWAHSTGLSSVNLVNGMGPRLKKVYINT